MTRYEALMNESDRLMSAAAKETDQKKRRDLYLDAVHTRSEANELTIEEAEAPRSVAWTVGNIVDNILLIGFVIMVGVGAYLLISSFFNLWR